MAAAARAGLLLRVSDQIVLAPGAAEQAAGILAGLPQPFTTAEARKALGSTRRVVIPLLEYLDTGRRHAAAARRPAARQGSLTGSAGGCRRRGWRTGTRPRSAGSAGGSPAAIQRASTAAVAGAFRMPVRK